MTYRRSGENGQERVPAGISHDGRVSSRKHVNQITAEQIPNKHLAAARAWKRSQVVQTIYLREKYQVGRGQVQMHDLPE
jgi:hypothetical protein